MEVNPTTIVARVFSELCQS